MILGKSGLAVGAAALVVTATVATAAPASAAGVWIQSVGRASADAPCPQSNGPAPQSGWVVTDWSKSWEQWMHGGKGGWTCTRTIIWAKDGLAPASAPDASPSPSGNYPDGQGCLAENDVPEYVDFNGGFYVPAGAQGYDNNTCTSEAGFRWSDPQVYAPAGFDADALCQEFAGLPYAYGPFGDDVYSCVDALP